MDAVVSSQPTWLDELARSTGFLSDEFGDSRGCEVFRSSGEGEEEPETELNKELLDLGIVSSEGVRNDAW